MSHSTVGAGIPDSHVDLFRRALCAVLTTIGPDGTPQSSLVWVDYDGECARVNTTLERRKGRNIAVNPRVSLLIVDHFANIGEVQNIFDQHVTYNDLVDQKREISCRCQFGAQ